MNKRYRRPVWAAVLCSLFAVSCDSGDIFEKDKTADGGVAVRGTFELLNPEVFPQQYDLIFGVFAADGTSALSIGQRVEAGRRRKSAVVNRQRARRGSFGTVQPDQFGPPGRSYVFEYDLDDDRTLDVDLPAVQIDLLEYDRIQRMVFSNITAFRAIREPAGQAACC